MNDCIFCKIVKGEVPSEKVWEDNEILAFKDIKPSAPVHILIIPKKHITNLASSTKEDKDVLGKIQIVAVEIADKLGIKDGFSLSTLSGEKAGQVVFHLHYHLKGGWE